MRDLMTVLEMGAIAVVAGVAFAAVVGLVVALWLGIWLIIEGM